MSCTKSFFSIFLCQIIFQTLKTSIIQKFFCKFLNKYLTSQSSKYTFVICTHLFITFFYCHIFLLFILILQFHNSSVSTMVLFYHTI